MCFPCCEPSPRAVHLDALWFEHRPEYEGFVDRIHDPLTKMVLDTNIYLHLPVTSYEGRRFLVLLEPMLSPAATNARIYGVDSSSWSRLPPSLRTACRWT